MGIKPFLEIDPERAGLRTFYKQVPNSMDIGIERAKFGVSTRTEVQHICKFSPLVCIRNKKQQVTLPRFAMILISVSCCTPFVV